MHASRTHRLSKVPPQLLLHAKATPKACQAHPPAVKVLPQLLRERAEVVCDAQVLWRWELKELFTLLALSFHALFRRYGKKREKVDPRVGRRTREREQSKNACASKGVVHCTAPEGAEVVGAARAAPRHLRLAAA